MCAAVGVGSHDGNKVLDGGKHVFGGNAVSHTLDSHEDLAQHPVGENACWHQTSGFSTGNFKSRRVHDRARGDRTRTSSGRVALGVAATEYSLAVREGHVEAHSGPLGF